MHVSARLNLIFYAHDKVIDTQSIIDIYFGVMDKTLMLDWEDYLWSLIYYGFLVYSNKAILLIELTL